MINKRDYLVNIGSTIHRAGEFVDFVYLGMLIEFTPNQEGYSYYVKIIKKLGEVSKCLEELELLIGGGASMI